MVSHELRTPLTAIQGSLGLISGGALGPLPAPALRGPRALRGGGREGTSGATGGGTARGDDGAAGTDLGRGRARVPARAVAAGERAPALRAGRRWRTRWCVTAPARGTRWSSGIGATFADMLKDFKAFILRGNVVDLAVVALLAEVFAGARF